MTRGHAGQKARVVACLASRQTGTRGRAGKGPAKHPLGAVVTEVRRSTKTFSTSGSRGRRGKPAHAAIDLREDDTGESDHSGYPF